MRERHIRVQGLSKDISQMGNITQGLPPREVALSQHGQQRASNSGSVECGFCRGEHLGVYCRLVETSQLGLARVQAKLQMTAKSRS
uniref:Uncharacterized protein n=1 Tax=Timema poppense TaxID=170557 RepID=A0A7R9DLZ5_TIMPO|nr:unnamed protein product [Timema poppensis]